MTLKLGRQTPTENRRSKLVQRLFPLFRVWRLGVLAVVACLPYGRFNHIDFSGLEALLWLGVWFLPLVGLHELGHALAARTQGVRLRGMSLGPLKIDLRGSRPSVRLSLYRLGGGQVILDIDRPVELPRRAFWLVLWGPLTNLILAATSYAALLRADATWPAGLLAALFTFSAMNAAIAVINLVPTFERGLLVSDGDALFGLLRARDREAVALTLGALGTLAARGTLGPDWCRRLAHLPAAPGLGGYVRGLVLHHRARETADHAGAVQAAGFMQRASLDLPPLYRHTANLYAALAPERPEPGHIDAALTACDPASRRALAEQGTWDLAQAVLSGRRGDVTGQRSHARRGLRQAQRFQENTLQRLNSYEVAALRSLLA